MLGGLVKGLAVIRLFGTGRSRLTVTEAAQGAGISRAAARRVLLTLAALDYVVQDGRDFRATDRLGQLGARPPANASLAALAEPILIELRAALHESVSVAVLDGGDALFIARAEADHIVSTGVRPGRRLPAYCSATGRILLGALTNGEARALIAAADRQPRTPRTVTGVEAILEIVVQARAEGVAISDEELAIGMRSMAVPIRDGAGRLIAALSISVSAERVSLDEMRSGFTATIQTGARRIELQLPKT